MQPFDYQQMLALHSTVIPLAIMALENDEDQQFMIGIYIQYRPLMYKAAQKYFSTNPAEIEDAVGDALLNMCKYCNHIRSQPASRLPSYIVTIVRNACNARLKQIYAAHSRNAAYADPAELEQLVDENAYHDIALSKFNALELLDSFRQLNERDKELIRMRHIDMMEYDEIAETLNISLPTARTAVFRARQRLEKIAAADMLKEV